MSLRRLPALAWEALLLELALYRSLARWVARRPDVPSYATPIGYAQLVGPMLWLWIFGSATEVVVIEVVLREVDAGWAEAIRLPLLVVGIWGVLWMLGLMAAYRSALTYSHTTSCGSATAPEPGSTCPSTRWRPRRPPSTNRPA